MNAQSSVCMHMGGVPYKTEAEESGRQGPKWVAWIEARWLCAHEREREREREGERERERECVYSSSQSS